MTATTDQRRAKAGGEYGPNGEWYDGGKFIATQADTIKRAPASRRLLTVEEEESRSQAAAKFAEVESRRREWIASRTATLSTVLRALEQSLWVDQWGNPEGRNPFLISLAQQLRANGSLSPRQAQFAAKAVVGRRTKRTALEFDELVDLITQEAAV